MTAEPDQTRRLRELLSDTIVLLCKNGLQFEQEFSIDALLGITLDRKNVMLVSIRETISTAPPNHQRGGIATTNGDQGEDERYIDLDSDSAEVEGGNSSTDADVTTNKQSSSAEQSTLVVNERNLGASTSRRSRTNVTKSFHIKPSSSLEFHQTSFVDNDTRLSCKRKKSEAGFSYSNVDKRLARSPRLSLVPIRQSTNLKNINIDDRNSCEDNTQSPQNSNMSLANSDSQISIQARSNSSRSRRLSATRRSEDSVSAASQGWGSVENSGYNISGNLGDFAVKVEEEECLDDVDHDASSVDPELFGSRADQVYRDSQKSANDNKDFLRSVANLHESTSCYNDYIQSHPALSPDDVSVASAILSIPGCFINMGCVKAIRQSLRKVSKETLVTVLERMSVPESSPFFVGAFRSEGVSRTFYKCPPDRLHPEALALYNVQYSAYVSGYYEPVRYPNNLKDPTEWIMRWKTFSPFADQRV